MKKSAVIVGAIACLYLVGRAVAEPFVIDVTNPGTYRNDWGGPSLFGVLAVHCGPGLVVGALTVWALLRRRTPRHAAEPPANRQPR